MKAFLILLILTILSCASRNKSEEPTDDKGERTELSKTEKPSPNKEIAQDSIELKNFWKKAVEPILMRDKATVLGNIEFPINGHCAQMMEIEACDSVSFNRNYDKFFSEYFIELLSKQNSKNAVMFFREGNVKFGFSIQDSTGQAAVFLLFDKYGDEFKLIEVQGAGGNFYWIK